MTNTQAASGNVRVAPIFSVMIAGAFIAFLNQTLVNVALPQMMDHLHISATTADWMTTIYMLVNGVVIPITAFLMDRFTTRQLYITSMGLFTIGTLICGIGPNFTIILIGRVVQAAGAGILMPLVTNIIFTLFPINKRGMAMGIFGIALNFAPAIGPTLSGWIVQTYSWRVLFFIILPIAIIDVIVAIFVLKNVTKTKRPKLDMLGVILSTVGFGGVLYGFSIAGSKGWGSTYVISMLTIGGICLGLFVWRQLAVPHAILEFRIFRYPMFTLTTIINVIVTMALYAGMILTPIFIQNILMISPFMSGLMYLPGGILMAIMSPITGKLFDKIGARWLSVAGLAIMVFTTFELSRLHTDTSYMYVLIVYTVRSFGMAIMMMPIMTAGLNELPMSLNRYGTAMLNTFRMIAGAVGMALLVTVMSTRTATHMHQIVTDKHILPTAKVQMAAAMKKATVMGINDAFLIAAFLAAIALILSFFIRKTRPSEDTVQEVVLAPQTVDGKEITNELNQQPAFIFKNDALVSQQMSEPIMRDADYRQALIEFQTKRQEHDDHQLMRDKDYRRALIEFQREHQRLDRNQSISDSEIHRDPAVIPDSQDSDHAEFLNAFRTMMKQSAFSDQNKGLEKVK
ncbi:DHA2 family efflux MFS transporter permease subunit [Scopulibacillus cellulosilyticus]|uniref:DHA2 family efflux MFS transporter permease subunit n=1 Tax=Scopulibacillus cellulosilyticus TaxID=2665665 RepID=A0ABW2Q1K2_9BACL